jgi:hypothetical protein
MAIQSNIERSNRQEIIWTGYTKLVMHDSSSKTVIHDMFLLVTLDP